MTASRIALAAAAAAVIFASAAHAQPITDVYALAITSPASGTATYAVQVAEAPLPGRASANAPAGNAAFNTSADRPFVVASPLSGRGRTDAIGTFLDFGS
jgi:hypothetical protein